MIEELDALHATYAGAVNEATEADELTRAEALALVYEDDAIQLMAEREGLTHLLPLRRAARRTPGCVGSCGCQPHAPSDSARLSPRPGG